MRTASFVFALLIVSQTVRGATAYEALRVLGKQRSESTLDNAVEVYGEKGRPQPSTWRIVVKDAAASGGYTEYSVQGTKLAGGRTPAARASGAPLNMSQLNLDSDGAHQIAEREAKKTGYAYDYANYRLRAGSRGGAPVWEIQLVDGLSGGMATMTVAATTGSVLSSEGFTNRRKVAKPVPAPVPAPVPQPELRPSRAIEEPDPVAEWQTPSGRGGMQDVGDGLNRFTERVGSHMEKRGRQVGNFFHNLFSRDKRNSEDSYRSEPSRTAPPPPRSTRETNDVAPPSRVRD